MTPADLFRLAARRAEIEEREGWGKQSVTKLLAAIESRRTIPLDRAERDAMETATGIRSIPTLVDGDVVVHGADEIVAYLDARHAEPPDAARHRAQMRVEWPHWIELEG